MDYAAILKRAFHITVKYRALWLFGILLAIFGGGYNGGRIGNFGNSGSGGNFSGGNAPLGDNPFATMDVAVVLAIIAVVILLVLALIVVGTIVRAVSRAALIGMVAKIETGDTVAVKDGWRIGWSARAWRIFLVNLLVGVPLAILAIVTLAFSASPLLLMAIDQSLSPFAIVLTVIFIIVWALFFFAISVIISPVLELSWRYTVLRETNATESLRSAVTLARRRLKDVVISVLVMFGVGIGVAISTFFIMIILLILGVMGGGIPALAGYLLTQETLVAVLAGVPIFLLIVVVPMLFFSGLVVVFQSTVWTLIFNELETKETPTTEPAIEPPADESPPTETADDETDDDSPPPAA